MTTTRHLSEPYARRNEALRPRYPWWHPALNLDKSLVYTLLEDDDWMYLRGTVRTPPPSDLRLPGRLGKMTDFYCTREVRDGRVVYRRR